LPRTTLSWVLISILGLLVTGCTACAKEMPDTGTASLTPEAKVEHPTLTIVYDNNAHDTRLRTDWGFACLVESGQSTVLFDTGGNGAILMDNMATLGIDPQAIDAVVLSHAHGDHTGGLRALLDAGVRPTVYALASFALAFKNEVRAQTELLEVKAPVEVAPGVHTTGRIGSQIPEQALVIEAADGPVILTGCAHPGIVEMVRRARQIVDQDPTLVLGGFHLGQTSKGQVEAIIADLRQLGVRQVAPCHCTGDTARRMFADAFGPDCILAGVGQVIEL
jgi:7,8-dihydropterin-6-yl-methyl-4-(beta-D-ribofuranosyl)aminobenzene 5'-phosphate synthase